MSIPHMENGQGDVMMCSSSGFWWWRGPNYWYFWHFLTYFVQLWSASDMLAMLRVDTIYCCDFFLLSSAPRWAPIVLELVWGLGERLTSGAIRSVFTPSTLQLFSSLPCRVAPQTGGVPAYGTPSLKSAG